MLQQQYQVLGIRCGQAVVSVPLSRLITYTLPCLALPYHTFPSSLSSVTLPTTRKKTGGASNRSLFRGVGGKNDPSQTAGGKSRGRLVLTRLLTKKTGLLLAIFAVAIAARLVSTRIPTMTEVSAPALRLVLVLVVMILVGVGVNAVWYWCW